MRILIATGIYPPEIGGPAEYAKNLAEAWENQGYEVKVEVFSQWNFLPTGIRHIAYFFSIISNIVSTDFVVTLDTFSAALPTLIASKIFRKKIILRTGGDFLWESYVERTGDKVLLRDFYKTSLDNLSIKEKMIFSLIRWTLQNLSAIIWSTEWQRDIFMKPYGLDSQKHFIVENYYGSRLQPVSSKEKSFIGSSRKLKWKNIDLLQDIFDGEEVKNTGALLDISHTPHSEFLEKIRISYSVIVVSLGDISPNTILDAIRCQKPFIVTKETGLYNRIKDIAIFVDPEDREDIKQKILWLSDQKNYDSQSEKIKSFSFTHLWEEMASEYINVYKSIK